MKSRLSRIVAISTGFLGNLVVVLAAFVWYRNDQYRIISVAATIAGLFIVMLVTGLVLLLFKKTKRTGAGILWGALFTLLIGFGICSLS